jgi:hypothetical protein
MAPTPEWLNRLNQVLKDWDDTLVGKVGEEDDVSDREKLRIKLGALLKRCGRSNRSDEFDAALTDGLDRRRLFIFPRLDGRLPSDSWLCVSRDPVPDPVLLFAKEQHLQEFLAADLSRLALFRGLELVKQQYPLPDASRIDLLLFDKKANEYVVVELKHHEAGYGGTTQLISYMAQLRKQRADKEGRGVRGMLLVGSIASEQQDQFATLSETNRIQLIRYEIQFDTEMLAPEMSNDAPVTLNSNMDFD